MNAPKIGGTLAALLGYTCKTCGYQIISEIPTEHCLTCWESKKCVSCGQPTENTNRVCNACSRVT